MSQACVLASSNTGKQREISAAFAPLSWEITLQSALGIDDAEETGLSFVENAILKARHAAYQTDCPVLADDSGLEVDALQGAPGVHSARYAGESRDFEANIECVLKNLKDCPAHERTARFRCVLVWLSHAEHPAPRIFEGVWEGRILTSRVGSNGFGYDPIFYSPAHQCSAAVLSLFEKNTVSHRAQALQQLIKYLSAPVNA